MPSAYQVVIVIQSLSMISADKRYTEFAKRMGGGGFVLSPVSEAKAIERRIPWNIRRDARDRPAFGGAAYSRRRSRHHRPAMDAGGKGQAVRAADRSPAVVGLAAACYRGVVRLYPQVFWRSYHDELEGDFEEASGEALDAGGWRELLRCSIGIAGDLSLTREWLRTPWPPAWVVAAAAATLAVAACIGRLHEPLHTYPATMVASGTETPRDSPELTTLLLVMALIPVVGVLVTHGAAMVVESAQ